MLGDKKSSLAEARRECYLCYSYQRIRANDDKKNSALTYVKAAYKEAWDELENLRKGTGTTPQIDRAKKNRIICLDAIDACNSCPKDKPRMKEVLSTIE